ncbi:Alpha/Beta hydrolase protein [Aspergillus leporis]|uniref:feruloyl esterase n=1 Tax=Aspergillus leporis TaxID=41062 RepID=A0A5N5WVI5_9EURO|nr:Alpha/Beta hydrolase protein [Aspergillus leporis]
MVHSALLHAILLCSQSLAMQQILGPYTEHRLQVIDPRLYETLTLFSEHCAAATCASNFNSSGGTKVVCEPGICPMLKYTDTAVLLGFSNFNPGNTTGFLAIDHTHHALILAFRGSRTAGNEHTDAQYRQEDIDGVCPGCKAHTGFYSAWGNFSEYIMPVVNHYAALYQGYSLIFTGHSLGGALATLGAVLEGTPTRPIYLFTYGCPELGNYNFAQFITNNLFPNDRLLGFRVTHTDDPVPKILSTSKLVNRTWQYSTTSPEFWITSRNGVPVLIKDIEVISGIDNKSGNLGTNTSEISAHDWYFGNMSGCATN